MNFAIKQNKRCHCYNQKSLEIHLLDIVFFTFNGRVQTLAWIKMFFKKLSALCVLIDLIIDPLHKFNCLILETMNRQKNQMICKASFYTTIWCVMLFLLGLSTSLLYTAQPILVWVYQRFNGNTNSWLSLPFQAA